jgi:aminoglycoside phosphotransferase (APT) family kinase protein
VVDRCAARAGDIVATGAGAPADREPLVVLDRLAAYLDEHGLGEGPLLVEAIGDGRSNATFLLRRGGSELVLRRPPRGPLPPSAHDVLREARILQALNGTDVPVPRVVAVCADERVLGAPFVVTERVDGIVVSDQVPAGLDEPIAQRELSRQLVDVLARIHAIHVEGTGLGDLGRPIGYLERQVRRHLQLWDRHRTRELPVVAAIGKWLLANLPTPGRSTLVHGDYRLGNAMFGRELPVRLVAVLDWELSTLGDPLVDVGYLCACWAEANDPPDRPWQPDPATRAPGCLSRHELALRYEEVSGRPVGDLRWYEVLALWRAVIFMEGNYRRARDGATNDPFLDGFGDRIPALAEMARGATEHAGR